MRVDVEEVLACVDFDGLVGGGGKGGHVLKDCGAGGIALAGVDGACLVAGLSGMRLFL